MITLEEKMKPHRAGYHLMEGVYYSMWINEPKNTRKMIHIHRVNKLRKVVRGKIDKYGK